MCLCNVVCVMWFQVHVRIVGGVVRVFSSLHVKVVSGTKNL